MPHVRTTITTPPDALDELCVIVSSGVKLADAVQTFLGMFPGEANPIPIPRAVLAPLKTARRDFLEASADYVVASVIDTAPAGPPAAGLRTHAADDPTPVGLGKTT